MRKRSLFLLVLFLFTLCAPVYASANVEPRANSASVSFTFDGTTANCYVNCRGDKTTDRISATLTLYDGNTVVDSWSESGVFRVSVSGECEVERGKTYELELTWSVNGVSQPSESTTQTCP